MGRRATKKVLRKAEQAISESRFADAEKLYSELMNRFKLTEPTLLDYARCVLGLVRVLYLTSRDDEAYSFLDSISRQLSMQKEELAVAAA